MKILIACDSFKDALDAPSVCRAIEQGLRLANPAFDTRIFPLADGGEGVTVVLAHHLGVQTVALRVCNPLFRPIDAHYGLSADGQTAFIEMAQAAGLPRLQPHERNPLATTTFGVGEMIADAARRGAQRIVIGLGGSATNDLGVGMMAALGWLFLDKNGEKVPPVGGNLAKIARIIPPKNVDDYAQIRFEAMSDVKNPLLGSEGAAHVYARQKGATDAAIDALEAGAHHFAQLTQSRVAQLPSAGAAGGLGFGVAHFLNAVLKSGIDTMLDLTHFDAHAAWADLIITGEGRLDHQTAQGKLISGLVARARPFSVVALCGALEAPPQYVQQLGLKAAFSITPKPCLLTEALPLTAANLTSTAFNIGRLLV